MKIYVRYRATSHNERLPSLARLAIGLLIAFGTTTLFLGHLGAEGATTASSTTAANPFPVSTNATSYSGTAWILVSGELTPNVVAESSVSITISNPKNVALVAQTAAVNGDNNFSSVFQASYDQGWNVTGQYTVTVMDVIPDFVGSMPTSYAYFQYTAVQPTTTTSSSTVATTSSSSSSNNSGPGISLGAVVPLVLVVVIVVAVVGLMLRSRGRRGPRSGTRPPPPARPPTTTPP